MKRTSAVISVGFLTAVLAGTGCSRAPNGAEAPSLPTVPSVQGPAVDLSGTAPGSAQIVTLSNGADIAVQNIGGKPYFRLEGTFSQKSFAAFESRFASVPASERDARMNRELERIFAKINENPAQLPNGAKALDLREIAGVAYFSFYMPYQQDLMAPLKAKQFDHELLLNPVALDLDAIRNAKAFRPADEGLKPQPGGRTGMADFSGLRRIGAPEFIAQAEADIGGGAKVNGSSVKLGVTDTGITYNHPTFKSLVDGHVRVDYMHDFTREGRVYFNSAAKFEVVAPTGGGAEDLTLNAQVIATPKLPSLPAGDQFVDLAGLQIKVSPELKAVLTSADHGGARLGVLLEDTMAGEESQVDLAQTGKTDDKFFMILLPNGVDGHSDPVVYFDKTGTADFRGAQPMGDWTKHRDMVNLVAERFGFDIKADKLPKADGSGTVDLVSASIVGFDPGNHGSHVSGIAAGSKTVLNDSADTLAHGVAPEANIYLNRVCANNGGCDATEAMIDLALNGGVEVINMSLGGLDPFNDGYGVQETIVNRLTSVKNVLFSISAGNSGPGHQTIGSPSTARLSLSIGASASLGLIQRQYQWPASGPLVDSAGDKDFMLFFSSRGPTAAGGFKPNVAAPGTELSSVQLNAAPGSNAGLDVYWGTSMAAPTATGAYALFLDAVKKYNDAHPDKKLSTDALTLREVLIQSARPFDVSSFDPQTGEKTSGQYTWIDEGKGLINLPAAWRKLKELRDNAVPSAVKLADGTSVDLDYRVVVQSKDNPNGIAYDGSRIEGQNGGNAGQPALGTGLYIDYNGTETLRAVYIQRNLPERLASGEQAGELTRQLEDTQDEFVLKTRIYGSDKNWIKAGVKDQLNCADSDTANLLVASRGVVVQPSTDGSPATVSTEISSPLYVCLDRNMIRNELPQGDNGALIEGYRVANGKVATLPSFTVPVYVTVPHKTLANSAGYQTERTIRSFDVSRNYVYVPQGTSVVRITLEVPALKLDANGLPAAGESCASVELMALLGNNSLTPYTSRRDARVVNCDGAGRPVTDEKKRKLVFTKTDPNPGMYDLHVFGSYQYAVSKYKLSVDYVTATTSVQQIAGDLGALTGSLSYTVKENSLGVTPDSAQSSLALNSLFAVNKLNAAPVGQHVYAPSPLGVLRAYPADADSVTIATGDFDGNDIDLYIEECPKTVTVPGDDACAVIGQSNGPTANESVTFKPKADKVYAARVESFDIKHPGQFAATETISLANGDLGSVTVSGSTPNFTVAYTMTPDQLAASKLLKSELFTSGKYSATGALTIRSADQTVLHAVPVKVTLPAPAPAPAPASSASPAPAPSASAAPAPMPSASPVPAPAPSASPVPAPGA